MLLQSVFLPAICLFIGTSKHTILQRSILLLGIWFENEPLQPGLFFLSESRGYRARDGHESTNRLRFAQGLKDRRQTNEG